MIRIFAQTAVLAFSVSAFAHGISSDTKLNFVQIKARDKFERSKIVDIGVSVESVKSDSVYGLASDEILAKVKKSDLKLLETFKVNDEVKGFDFPKEDERFHNYAEMTKALEELVAANKNLLSMFSIGKTIQNRDIWAVQINTNGSARNASMISTKPGVVFMGNHHAREHVSAEMPLMLLEFLVKNYGVDKNITSLVDSRDIYIIPMVNPDGVEYDIESGRYRMQRKNMRPNSSSHIGVDLNRNYGFKWGTGGSSKDPSSDIYMGPTPFSEPETQAIKGFVENHPNLKVLLTFHTFSELILYPWGHKYDSVEKKEDLATFEAMARKMATWNKYTPQQASDLYIASGDTTDWAYGALGIFAFTFELSPKEMWDGGFYPGAGILDRVFQDNLRPALYMLELADNPHRSKGFDAGLDWLETAKY